MEDFEGLKKKKKVKKVIDDASIDAPPAANGEEDDFADLKKKKKKKTLNIDDDATPAHASEEVKETKEIEDDFGDLKKKKKKKVVVDEEVTPAPVESVEDDFSDLKKPKKKKKVDLDALDALDGEPSKPSEEAGASAEPSAGGDDEFADLKKKKKKKVLLDVPTEAGLSEPGKVADGEDDFSDLRKKSSKKKKKDFDLDAFEKELQASGAGGSGDGPDGEGRKDLDRDADGDNAFEGAADGSDQSVFLRAAKEQKWLKEDRDYKYDELLGRFYTALYLSHPNLSPYSNTGAKRYTLAPPQVQREGNKRSIFTNVEEICRKMHRSPEHVIQFLFAELGTTGSVDGNGSLVIKGRFQGKQIENVLRRYILEYVTCKICKSPDTLLEKDNRLFFVDCQTCHSRRSVSAIKTGYQAQIGKRIKTDK